MKDIEIIQPWSSFIIKSKLPSNILKKLIKVTEECDKKNEYLKEEITRLPYEEVKEDVIPFIEGCANIYAQKQYEQNYPLIEKKFEWNLKLSNLWYVDTFDNQYSPLHSHTKCSVSGALYIKLPDYLPDRKIEVPGVRLDSNIVFTGAGMRGRFSNPQIQFHPEVGDIFIFPAHQLHMVQPFQSVDGKGVRRCVAFSARVRGRREINAR